MEYDLEYEPEFESLKCLLLEMAQERSLCKLMQLIVQRLADRPHMASARLWLIQPGDLCDDSCPQREVCPSQESCLHIAASAANPKDENIGENSHFEARFQRIPLGVGAIGKIGESGEAIVTPNIQDDPLWEAHREWIMQNGIIGFSGQPVVHKGKVLGVLAVFPKIPTSVDGEGSVWLRMLADHAASAIANAQAFEEIDHLRCRLEMDNAYLNEEVVQVQSYGDIIGNSPALLTVVRQIEMVSPTDASVLIVGESGTGKELVAREIHRNSQRNNRPMIKVNCASIPRELYESEFFGHVKGAFTGAIKDRMGRFELADGGTLFLDEVGEIPPELQSKLLRVLQEGTFERVGDEKMRAVDVRVISATNRDLKQEVEAGRFRNDLYYRLNVFPIEVPPLRLRPEDIPPLADHFLEFSANKLNRTKPRLTERDLKKLLAYSWPGNARELQNVIERAVIISQSAKLQFDLPLEQIAKNKTASALKISVRTHQEVLTDADMTQREIANTLLALEKTGGKIYGAGGAAELLQMNPTTLSSRLRKPEYGKRARKAE
jgi:transcriptional regulator with GAF, ATPase, and Fis domain